jgi:hypothetical protein
MKFIISESHRKKLITESILSDIESTLSNLKELGKKTLEDTKNMVNFDLKFLLTWSTTIGGFMGPLTNFILSENPDLSREEVSTIAIGVSAFLFYNNIELARKIYNSVVEKGLGGIFEKTMDKGIQLRDALMSFLSSIGLTIQNVSHVAAFTFLIPVVGYIIALINGGELTGDNVEDIVKRITAAGVTYLSINLIKNVVGKLIDRTKSTS